MTTVEAILTRARLKATKGWAELAEQHPRFALAIESLPDESGLSLCNPVVRGIYEDARKWAKAKEQQA